MRATYRSITLAVLFLAIAPAMAVSYDRFDRDGGKAAAYRAGFDDGYRAGVRHGEFDFRGRLHFDFRGRDHFRGDGYYGPVFRYKGDYNKGYRDGYHQGYRDGYRRFEFRRAPYPRRYPY